MHKKYLLLHIRLRSSREACYLVDPLYGEDGYAIVYCGSHRSCIALADSLLKIAKNRQVLQPPLDECRNMAYT